MSAFLDETGTLITVDHSNPLPVVLVAGFTSLNDGELKTASYANPLPVTVVTTNYTEQELPDADSVAVGTEVFNTTYQVKMRSNGTKWIPLSHFSFYAADVSDEITGTTDLVLMREIDLPQKYIGKNGRISLFLQSLNSSNANNKTLILRLWDGTTEWEFLSVASTTNWKTIMRTIGVVGTECNFFNVGKTSISDSTISVSSSGSSQQLSASSSTFKLRIYGQLANSGDLMRLTKLNLNIIPSF